jgi:hypothetical protein
LTSAAAMAAAKPYFIVTIDTEGDNLWARPREITTRNALFLPRFQDLCARHGLRPTYLVNYEMAVSPVFREFGRDLLARGSAEIGMHLHAWNSPPLVPLTDDDFHHQPYLLEYPEAVIQEKVKFMTGLLEESFGVKMTSHRAGRWGMSPALARVLLACGYLVDCSVTPHVSWANKKGDPRGRGGTDYSLYPETPYFLDLVDLSRPGDSPLLEVPVTILSQRRPLMRLLPSAWRGATFAKRVIDRLLPADWMMPTRYNATRMPDVLPRAVRAGRPYVEFIMHSSEFMPGGSPSFFSDGEVEGLYERLEALFEEAGRRLRPATLTEYRHAFVASRSGGSPLAA